MVLLRTLDRLGKEAATPPGPRTEAASQRPATQCPAAGDAAPGGLPRTPAVVHNGPGRTTSPEGGAHGT